MGLIWTLILHYSISMPVWEGENPETDKDRTPKQRLLAWIQSKIPEKNITNFTSDWNDGTAIAALVDALAPGLCPDWPEFNPRNAVPNAKQAMDAAEKWMDVPQLIRPEEMTNPKVDELSMMTYLSRFPNAKVRPGAPLQVKTNPARVRAYGPGLESNGNVVGAPARFTVETFGAGKGDLEVVVQNPKGVTEMCQVLANNDRLLSFTCVYVPSVEGQYKITIKYATKDIPKSPYLVNIGKVGDPKKVIVQGPGSEKTGVQVKRKTYFEVITKGCGAGVVDVGIVDPAGVTNSIRPVITKKTDDLWYVEYTAVISGLHSVNVFFGGKAVPKSPFAVGVATEGGPALDVSKLPKPQTCTPLEAALATLATPLKATAGPSPGAAGEPAAAPAVEKPLEAAAQKPAQQVPGKPAPGKQQPAKPAAPDAKKCYAQGRGVQAKGLRVGDDADIKIFTEGSGGANGEPRLMIMGPGGLSEKLVNPLKKVNGYYTCTYRPSKPGLYIVSITYAGNQIQKSPFKVDVAPSKVSKIRAHGPGLETGVVGEPAKFVVEQNGEPGTLGLRIEGPSPAKLEPTKKPDGTMEVSYYPTEPGEYAVHVLCNNEDIPKSPFMADIKAGDGTAPAAAEPAAAAAAAGFDASKVEAYGPGLQPTGVTANSVAEFTVDASKAGLLPAGELPKVFVADVSSTTVKVDVIDNKNSTFTCRYTPTRAAVYTVTITFSSVAVQNSPFKVIVESGSNPSKVKVYGPAIEKPVKAFQSTYLIVDCKEAGTGETKVNLTNERNAAVPFKLTDNGDKTYRVEFEAKTIGFHTVTVTFAGKSTPGSPYKVKVEAGVDVSKVQVKGLPENVPVGKEVPFEISTAAAGKGPAKVTITGPTGQNVPCILAEKPGGFNAKFTPTEAGPFSVQVTFVDRPVPNSPFSVNAQEANDPSKVKVSGPALEGPVQAYHVTYLIIDCKAAGSGEPVVALTDAQGRPLTVKLIDNKDRTYRVEFETTVVGTYTSTVTFASQPVPGSPFKISVVSSVDVSKVLVKGLPESVTVNKPVPFEISTAGAGKAPAEVNVSSPSGKNVPCAVVEKPEGFNASFTPTETGPHVVQVNFDRKPVPNSPFKVVSTPGVDASKVIVSGPAIEAPVTAKQLTYLVVDCKQAGNGPVQVTLTNAQGVQIPVHLIDNKDQTYRVEFTTTVVGAYTLNVTFASVPVKGSPFRVNVVPAVVDLSKVQVEGLPENAPVGKEIPFNVVTPEGPIDSPLVSVTGPTGKVEQSPVQSVPNGIASKFTPKEAGPHKVDVSFANKPVPNSPFKVNAVDVSKVQVKNLPPNVPVNNEVSFQVDTAAIGPLRPELTVVGPSGAAVPSSIEPTSNVPEFTGKFTPVETGPHTVNVKVLDEPVPSSPFQTTAVSVPAGPASKVKVYGSGLTSGTASKPADFTIDTREAGPGGLGLTIDGPTEAKIECFDRGAGLFDVRYWPTEPGQYTTNVLFDDQPVPGSPFKAQINPVKMVDVSGIKVHGLGVEPTGVFSESTTDFIVDAKSVEVKGDGVVKALITTPTGLLTEAVVNNNKDGVYECLYTPMEQGQNSINVTYDGIPVPGSPFNVEVVHGCDPSRVKVFGPGLRNGQINVPQKFTIKTRGAGPGGVGLSVIGPTEPKVGCVDNRDGTLTVEYLASSVGDYEIGVTFADQPVVGSPFRATVTEHPSTESPASNVSCRGTGLEPNAVHPGQPATFTVDASKAPVSATAEVVVTDLTTGQSKPVQVTPKGNGLFDVTYTPDKTGPVKVDIKYGGESVPNSPFTVDVKPRVPDLSKVTFSGPGLNRDGVPASLPVTFTIDSRFASDESIEVTVTNSRGKLLRTEVRKLADGTYTVSYTPEEVGPHTIRVKVGGQEVPSGPFVVNTVQTGNASVVTFTEEVSRTVVLNQESTIRVRKVDAGVGRVTCTITSSTSSSVIYATVVDNNDGTVTIKYKPTSPGTYNLDIKFGGVSIPNGNITQQVDTPAPTGEVAEEQVTVNKIDKAHTVPQLLASFGETVAPVESPTEHTPSISSPLFNEPIQGQKAPTSETPVDTPAPTGEVVEEQVPVNKIDKAHTVPQLLAAFDEPVVPVERPTEHTPSVDTPAPTGEVAEEQVTVNKIDKAHTVPQLLAAFDEPVVPVERPTEHAPSTGGQPSEVDENVVVPEKSKRVHAVRDWPSSAPVSDVADGAVSPKITTQGAPQTPQSPNVPVSPAPAPTSPGLFHGTNFCIPIGPDFGLVAAVVTTPSLNKYQPTVVDNKNGTVKIDYKPTEAGPHTLEVTYAGVPLQGSPYKFNVQKVTPGKVSVYGPGLSSGLAGEPASFTVVTKDAGPGGLGVAIEGPSKVEILPKDNKDGTVSISYTPRLPGEYKIVVKYAGQLIEGAPFYSKISAPYGEEPSKSQMTLGTQGALSLTVTETDLTNLTATIRRPSGTEEPCGLRRQPSGQLGISFTPREFGDHYVTILRSGQPIPGSPFKVTVGNNEIGDATKVRVGGRGLMQANANEVNEFFVNTRDAGIGGLGMSIEGPGKVEIKCFENPGGACKVAYNPSEPGTYQLTIKYADEHIPGSPFTVNVAGQPSGRLTEKLTCQSQAVTQTSTVGAKCELNINLTGIDVQHLEGSITSPSGTTRPCDVVDLGNGRFTINFVPNEMGVHAVSLKYNGLHIPGSPFQFTVGPIAGGGPHKVRAVGSGLERGEVNKQNPFTIITREAGAGGLSLGIEGPSKAVIDFQDRQNGTSDVNFTVSEPGEYLITIKFNDQPIPDSPFKVYILPASGDSKKLQVNNLQRLGLQVNTSTQFLVDFNGAQGKLDAKVVAPSGTETEATIQQLQADRHAVNFVPRETGTHYVHVRLNGVHVPGSPYKVQVGQVDADASKVRAYGDGLQKGTTGQLCNFIVDTSQAASGPLSVSIGGPSRVELIHREIDVGYEFSYTPLAPGDYLITIKYAGNTHVPGSPFKAQIAGSGQPSSMFAESRVVIETVKKTVTTTSQSVQQQQVQQFIQQQQQQIVQQQQRTLETAPPAAADASKVYATGSGLQKAFVNQEASFLVDGSQTGYNMLVIGIAGPQVPCHQLHAIHMGNLKYIVKYQLSQPGNYQMIVKWGDQHIPGSPYNIVAQ